MVAPSDLFSDIDAKRRGSKGDLGRVGVKAKPRFARWVRQP